MSFQPLIFLYSSPSSCHAPSSPRVVLTGIFSFFFVVWSIARSTRPSLIYPSTVTSLRTDTSCALLQTRAALFLPPFTLPFGSHFLTAPTHSAFLPSLALLLGTPRALSILAFRICRASPLSQLHPSLLDLPYARLAVEKRTFPLDPWDFLAGFFYLFSWPVV